MAAEVYEPKVQRKTTRHSIRGVDYCVSEWGDRNDPLLLLLHGWGDSGGTFQFMVDCLEQNWFVVAPDWRGFGESGHSTSGYWFPDYVADLDALLSIYSPEQPARLFGHSMGGNIAALFAGIFPERVSHFINAEGFGLRSRAATDAPVNYRRWIEQSRTTPSYRDYEKYAELAARIRRQSARLSASRALFVAEHWARADEDGKIRIKADPAHKLPNAVLYRRAEAEACWAAVTAQVLLLSGADSDFAVRSSGWADTDVGSLPFPNAVCAEIAEAGHMLHFEQPAELARLGEAFLQSSYL